MLSATQLQLSAGPTCFFIEAQLIPPQALQGISIAAISRMSITVVVISARVLARLVLFPDHGSRVKAGYVRNSGLSDCLLASFR